MDQEKKYLIIFVVIMSSLFSLIGKQTEEKISSWALSYVQTVTQDYFASNLDNIRLKPLSGGYSSAENVLMEVVDKMYVLRIMSESESSLKRQNELYAMKTAGQELFNSKV